MSDIVERLNSFGYVSPPRDPKDYACHVPKDVLLEASAEIVRLRELTTWRPVTDEQKTGSKFVMWAPGFGLGALTLYWMDGYWREPANALGLKVLPTYYLNIPPPPETP